MIALDTGICAPESEATLRLQQDQLIAGRRDAQMFPKGTDELPLPEGLSRCETERGVFHYRPSAISRDRILRLSTLGRENEFLLLGPYSKFDIAVRAAKGEEVLFITEYVDGVELRSACGVPSTMMDQGGYFHRTREPGCGSIVVGGPPPRVVTNWKGR